MPDQCTYYIQILTNTTSMAATPRSPSTFVEMEPDPLDIATPECLPSAQHLQLQHPLCHHTPNAPRHFTPIQTTVTGAQVRFAASMQAGSTPIQTLFWEQEQDANNMQLCTSPEPSPLSLLLKFKETGVIC